MAEITTDDILLLINGEIERARAKHGLSVETANNDKRLRILVEEVGEVASALEQVEVDERSRDRISRTSNTEKLEHAREVLAGSKQHVLDEVLQVVTTGVRWLLAEVTRCDDHAQCAGCEAVKRGG